MREEMLKTAIADCLKNHEAVTPAAVRSHLVEDFFFDDMSEPMTDAEVFAEIQAAFNAVPKPGLMINTNPDGHRLEHQLMPDPESEDDISPVVKAAPVREASAGLSQVRLNVAYRREGDLVGARNRLAAEHRAARDALEIAKQAWQRHDPHRQTPEQVAAEFRAQGQRDREARKGAYRLTTVASTPRGEIAYVDLERKYSQGGDANSFVRSRAGTLNRRGAYSKSEAARAGFVNRDDRRGGVPAPVVVARPTIPVLGK